MDFDQSNLEMENEEEMVEEYLDEIETPVLEGIYGIEDKIQDDLYLIALVEGNPRLYAKEKAGYRNVHEKDMAWISISTALKHPLSGSEAKHRWDTLRNLYDRARREIVALTKQQGLSGSGKDNVSYEDLLTPQSMAIHRFMAPLYVPRKTVSNYTKSTLSTSSSSSSSSKSRLPIRPHSRPSFMEPSLNISKSKGLTTSSLKDSPRDSLTWNQNFVANISDG
ncbi:hypothetical protein ALC57_13783 [Trachymyrmex cornetzi]|uniref:MADF domain-containing protein n=1 Tax=Trachymyrmex cornetzi TaxID=471704 RepID=A0A151IZ89_9HYME|nr:hypothetical protein ALC57_13783 [Trachymyrmex cornetzi]